MGDKHRGKIHRQGVKGLKQSSLTHYVALGLENLCA